MTHAIRRAAAWAARHFRPPTALHRAALPATPQPPARPPAPAPLPARWAEDDEPFFADDHVLVRPYVLVAEEQARRQNERLHRALVLCTHLDMAEVL